MRWTWIVMLVMGLAACGRGGGSATTAPAATTQTNAATPATQPSIASPRVISTVPAATLNLILMGGVDSLVGVSKYDVLFLPEAKRNLPVVGDYEQMNYELLVGLKPTAVVVQFAQVRVPARLKELAETEHFEIVNVKLESTEELWVMAGTLGRISGREAAAEIAVRKAQQELKEMARENQGKPRPRVLYVVGRNPLMVVGGRNFLDEMIDFAGGQNAGAEAARGWPVISTETLVKLAPDVLLVGAPDQSPQQVDDPRLEPWMRYDIPAVKEKRVYLVTDGDSEMPTVDLPRSVRMLSRMIHKGDVKHETRNTKHETEEATTRGGTP